MSERKLDPKALKPGTRVRHRSGGVLVLDRRKDTDDGWWNTDGSGFADWVIAESKDFTVLAAQDRGVTLNCLGCGREVVLPPAPDRPGYVSIEPIDGWTAPPLLCPECSKRGARTAAQPESPIPVEEQ